MKKLHFVSIVFGMLLSLSAQTYVCSSPETPTKDDIKEASSSSTMKVSSEKNKWGHHALKIRIQIDAPANLVWDAIRENRLGDPDVLYSKFTQVSESERILEQRYVSLPLFGSTTCFLKLNEELNRSIDYSLIKSDRLSEFEGTWVLTPIDNNRSTLLELTNHLKLNLPVPQRLIDAFAGPKLKTRVLFVKNLAESKKQLQIAAVNTAAVNTHHNDQPRSSQ